MRKTSRTNGKAWLLNNPHKVVMSVAAEEGKQGTTIFTGCTPPPIHISDFQEIPIQNLLNSVHNYKVAHHFPDDDLIKKKKLENAGIDGRIILK
jgi:hypothetical protein